MHLICLKKMVEMAAKAAAQGFSSFPQGRRKGEGKERS